MPASRLSLESLIAFESAQDPAVDAAVAAIIDDVRTRGDAALVDYTRRFDRLDVPSAAALEVQAAELAAACDALPRVERDALEQAVARVRRFHERQKATGFSMTDDDGSELGQRITPLDRVGIYVPGGKAAYPSSVIMNAVPAHVAGVPEIVMAVPTPDGVRNPLVLAAAHIAGVQPRVHDGRRAGHRGARVRHATVPAVDKICGPGNAYVAAAKRRVFGVVGIDMVAGVSEIVIVADARRTPTGSRSTSFRRRSTTRWPRRSSSRPTQALVGRVARERATAHRRNAARGHHRGLARRPRRAHRHARSRRSMRCREPHRARAPRARRRRSRRAAARASVMPVPSSSGITRPKRSAITARVPNHVLPTGRTARFSSPLGVYDFEKRSSVLRLSRQAAQTLGPIASTLARGEGLVAHARVGRSAHRQAIGGRTDGEALRDVQASRGSRGVRPLLLRDARSGREEGARAAPLRGDGR